MREGWRGLVEGIVEPLERRDVSGILPRGGTILGTSRTNPYKVDGGVEQVLEHFEREGLAALVAIGGEDTLGVAARLHAEQAFPVVGVPKTIDNDLSGTDYTFGFDTAVFDRDRGDRPAAHDGRVAQPGHGRRGDGPPHRLDRAPLRDRRRRRRDPDPRAAGHGRGRLRAAREAARRRQGLLDRRRQRGLRAHLRVGRAAARRRRGARHRPVRPRRPRRRRRRAGPRDRGADGLRDPRHRARARAARRHADAARPRAGDALRAQGGRPRRRRHLRPDGRAARRRDRRRLARGGDQAAEDGHARVVRGRRRRSRASRTAAAARRSARSRRSAPGRPRSTRARRHGC